MAPPSKPLANKICLVTGATRGIGKGIALQLGEAGAIVYITGRTVEPKGDKVGGSISETVDEINARGGKGIGVQCDHSKDSDVERLFERIKSEQNGRLDVLVNNAYSAVKFLMENSFKKFWETPLSAWDEVNNVGLRNHYLCSVLAARLMVPRGSGLIVNVSSAGGLRYVFNVAYGVGKAAVDRMAADMAIELKGTGVTAISLWPGAVQTEEIMTAINCEDCQMEGDFDKMKSMFAKGESTEFAGKAVAALVADANVGKKNGRVLLTADLAKEYGFRDVDNREIVSMRSVQFMLRHFGWDFAANYVPSWLCAPYWVMAIVGSKF